MHDNQLHELELKIMKGFTEANEQRKSHKQQIEKIETHQEKILECIHGNGKPGLVQRISDIKHTQSIMIGISGFIATTAVAMAGFFIM